MDITESGGNNSLQTAQDVTPYLSKSYNPDVEGSETYPHVTISATGDNAYDWFKVTLSASSNVILDIDYGMPSFDPWLEVYNSAGSLIGSNDDGGLDPGSVSPYDSKIYTALPAGDYFIKVARFPDAAIPSDGHYQLQITVPGNVSANRPPVAVVDSAVTDEDSAVTIAVLANDSDPDNDPLTISYAGVTAGAGTVSISDGKLRFTPGSDYQQLTAGQVGSATITYTISDGKGASATSTASVAIKGTNDAPVAGADSAATNEDSTVSIAVLANDSDVDHDSLTITGATVASGGGTVSVSDGKLLYTPGSANQSLAPGQSSNATLSYAVSDGHGGTASATVTVAIQGVNDAPVAGADSVGVNAGQSTGNLWSALLLNDSDIDAGDIVTIVGVNTTGSQGTVQFNASTKTLVFVADNPQSETLGAGQTATTSFGYTIRDTQGAEKTGTVTVNIAGVEKGKLWNGGNGADTITGNGGNDTINGGNGVDVLSGNGGNDLVDGGNGDDELFGDAGNDTLIGDNGADRLTGGVGNDVMTGGRGADTFVFASNSGADRITDFDVQGLDVIRLQGIAGLSSFAAVKAGLSSTSSGAVLTLGTGSSILFEGVSASSFTAANFVFS